MSDRMTDEQFAKIQIEDYCDDSLRSKLYFALKAEREAPIPPPCCADHFIEHVLGSGPCPYCRLVELESALKNSVTALDDWLNTYAAEMCDEKRVKEAMERIGPFGTIGYIAHIQAANREALEQL